MFRFVKGKGRYLESRFSKEQAAPNASPNFSHSLLENTVSIRERFSNSSDLIIKPVTVSGFSVSLVMCEGMVGLQTLSEMLLEPIQRVKLPEKSEPEDLLQWI